MSPMKTGRFVIVGAALAGASAAAALREEGFEGEITLIGAEPVMPYNRPPLSKGYLRGQDRFEDQLVNPAEFYAEHRIDLRLGVRADAVDPTRKVVSLERGDEVAYDRLLVATGGRNRALTTPGADLSGIFQLRTVEDCDRIRAVAKPGRRAVVIGLGFIGSEVTASLRQMGVEVTAVEGNPVPLARVLGPEVGAVLAGIHREKGVELVLEDHGGGLRGRGPRWSACARRRDGCSRATSWWPASASCPTRSCWPRRERRWTTACSWTSTAAPRCPTSTRRATWRTTSIPCSGGCASSTGTTATGRAGPRPTPWRAASEPYDYMHSFWSDQYEHVVEYIGFAATWDRLVFRGDLASRKFLGFYLKDGVVRAAMGLDRGGDPEDPKGGSELGAVAGFIRDRVPVDPARLADEGVDLKRIARP